MHAVLLVIHLMIALAMVGVILIQRSEGGGLGIGGGTMGGMMTARGTANLLTRTTAILAGCFMVTSIVLAIMAGSANRPASIIDDLPQGPAPSVPGAAPGTAPTSPVPAAPAPATPAEPAPPVAQ